MSNMRINILSSWESVPVPTEWADNIDTREAILKLKSDTVNQLELHEELQLQIRSSYFIK